VQTWPEVGYTRRPLSGVSRPGSWSWEEFPGELGVVSSMNMYFESGRPRKPAPQ
jgi:hypothetical protein